MNGSGLASKIILEERLQSIEVEVKRIRKRIEPLPFNHEVSWAKTQEKVERIVADAFRDIDDPN